MIATEEDAGRLMMTTVTRWLKPLADSTVLVTSAVYGSAAAIRAGRTVRRLAADSPGALALALRLCRAQQGRARLIEIGDPPAALALLLRCRHAGAAPDIAPQALRQLTSYAQGAGQTGLASELRAKLVAFGALLCIKHVGLSGQE